ncbi:hypothetical protein HanIR_Chr12g0607231 [Helianthus annuus]|nr:hypothetical protein HanIR_Chr12g0607231 [Helianthus annuus]
MIGFSESSGSVWRIEVTKAKHNHTPIENFEGHAYARRLTSEDKKLVKELAEQDIPNQSIWRTLTKNNPARKLIPKDTHNVVQKINAEKNVGSGHRSASGLASGSASGSGSGGAGRGDPVTTSSASS